MNPEERYAWEGNHEEYYESYQARYWCDVCGGADSFEHEVVTEHDIAGNITLIYCTHSGNVVDESKNRDITQAELDYVKKSLGVT